MACDPHPQVQKYPLEKSQVGQSVWLCPQVQLLWAHSPSQLTAAPHSLAQQLMQGTSHGQGLLSGVLGGC